MPATLRLVLRGAKYTGIGALVGATLGLLMLLPGELATHDSARTPGRSPWPLILGVALACMRLGGVVGLIVFLLKRALTGEIADPRLAAHRSPPDR